MTIHQFVMQWSASPEKTKVARPSCSIRVRFITNSTTCLDRHGIGAVADDAWDDAILLVVTTNLIFHASSSSPSQVQIPTTHNTNENGWWIWMHIYSQYYGNLSTLWGRTGLNEHPVHSRPKRKNLKEASCLQILLELPCNVDLGEGGGSISSTTNGYWYDDGITSTIFSSPTSALLG